MPLPVDVRLCDAGLMREDHAEGQPAGIGVEDLPGLMRELYDTAVADARAVADPEQDPDGFIDELWEQLDAAFGLTRREWPQGAPQPWPALVDEQRGVAEAVLEGRLRPGQSPS